MFMVEMALPGNTTITTYLGRTSLSVVLVQSVATFDMSTEKYG